MSNNTESQYISLGIPEKKAKDGWLHVQLQTQWVEHQILLRSDIGTGKMVDLLEMSLFKRLYRLPGKDEQDDFREETIKKYNAAIDQLDTTRYTNEEIARQKFILLVTIIERRITDQLDRYGGITHDLKVAKGAVPFWDDPEYKKKEEEDVKKWLGAGKASSEDSNRP